MPDCGELRRRMPELRIPACCAIGNAIALDATPGYDPGMREIFRPGRMWRRRGELRDSYDVVIIGGGAHGLSTAYHLGRLGVRNVAVLERGYIGSGAAGRNTTILRSNQQNPEGARFYDASIRMYESLSAGLRL